MADQKQRTVVRTGHYRGTQGGTFGAGISAQSAGAERLCLHRLVMAAGSRGRPHLHEGHESAIYIQSGQVEVWPESFSESMSRTDALYFTMTVFSTVGFGDITPRTEPARLLTTGQMTANFLLIGVAARFLVGAVQEGRRLRDLAAKGDENGGPPNAR